MTFQAYLNKVVAGDTLQHDEMTDAMHTIMTGGATPAQIGGFLVGMRMRGETIAELSAAASVMRALATPVKVNSEYLVDTCGTGGDSSGTFNISTASAFVCAAAGASVAKHGNRSVSSQSGSADVLEAAGVNLEVTPEQVADCINTLGVGFLFAQKHHSAMRHAIGPRKELGMRTLFNLLGPLTNPAAAPNQVVGVFSQAWVNPLAHVLQQLGSRHVMVVNAQDGLDEISIAAPTQVAEYKDGVVRDYIITPEDFGLHTAPLDSLRVETAQESLALIRSALSPTPSPAQAIVALNAGAAIYVSGVADSHQEGVDRALRVITDGSALQRMEQLAALTQR